MPKAIHFIFNPSEIGAGTRGASLGPEAIRAAARTKGSQLFAQHPIKVITEQNDLLDHTSPFPFAKNIDGLQKVFDSLNSNIASSIAAGAFPLIIAGDHSSAAGTLAALKNVHPEKRIGVIWIDAHADIHSPYTTPSGNMHGMPIAAALGLDHQDIAKNQLDTETQKHWNALKSYAFSAQDLVYIGVRDTEEEEDHVMAALKLRNYSVAEIREKGLMVCLEAIKDKLAACDLLYVSFDVDSMDPKETSVGTGTPVANGLHPNQAKELLQTFYKSPKLVSMEFVEINPCLDDKMNQMATITFSILEAVIATVK